MIVGALIQQQERDKSLSIHCRSPLAHVQSYCMDDLLGISRIVKKQEPSPQSKKQQSDENSQVSTKDSKGISDEEKVIKILQKPKNLRSFQELMFLYQELEKLEYFQSIKQRCKELRYREAINALSYKFVEKDDFIIRKNEIGNDFYIIFQGSCFVLDEDDSLTPSQQLAQIAAKNHMNNILDCAKTPSSSHQKVQQIRSGFSNFRQAFQTWNDNNVSNHSDSKQDVSSDKDDKIAKNKSSKKNSLVNSPSLSHRKSVLRQRSSILKIPLADASFRRESLIHSLFKSSIPNLKIIKLLSKGETFGEKSILSNFHKRTAYVQAKEDCHLIYLSKQDYLNIIGNEKRQQIEKITDFLSEFKFLEGWQYHDIKQLSQNFYEDKFAKGEYVFKEGDKSQNIYIIKRGEISIQKEVNFQVPQVENLEESRPKNLQKNIEIACLKEGEIFGEEAVIQYESARCFSAQVKSQKFKLIKINAQHFLDKLWDPNSKQIFLQQANQKLKWRSERYHNLTQMHLKRVKEKEQLDQKSYKVKPKIKKIIDTPDKQFVLEEKFLSPKGSLNLQKSKNSKTNENILVINTKYKQSKQNYEIDKEVIKKKYSNLFPIAWLLRQQEVTLKDTFQTSYTSKISDSIQKLRPMASQIDQKRSEIFSSRIKSGQIKSSASKNVSNINNINFNKQTKPLENSNSQINSQTKSQKLKKFSQSITSSPINFFIHKNRNSNFTEELNQLLQTSSNHSKFYPQSQRSSDSRIAYLDINQQNKFDENLFNQSFNQFSRPTSSQTTPKMSKQSSFDGQQTQRNAKLQNQEPKKENTLEKKENTLEEKELIKKQKDFIKNKSTLLRGFSATQKRQNFFHTMSMGEEEEQKKMLYLRKYLEENKAQIRLQKTKRVSLDYHIDKEKNKQKLWKSYQINLIQNNFSRPKNQNKSQNQDQKAKKGSISSDQFSLFDDEYSKYSKEEQERLRYQEIQFDEVLDNNLSVQMSIIEKDMMETLSMKGQQITNQLNQEIQKQNNDFILNLFLKKGKYYVNSPRLQRTIDYIKILKQKDESKKYLQEQIKLALDKLKQESNQDSPILHFEDYDLNFVQSKKKKQNQEINKQQENIKNQSQLQESQKLQIFKSNSSQNANQQQTQTQETKQNLQQQHRRIKKSSFATNFFQNFLTLRPQTAATSYKFQSSLITFQEQNNQSQLKQLLAKSKIPNTLRVSVRPQTAQQEEEEEELLKHKKIIENQLKKQKSQTSAFEVMNKLIFESDDNQTQNTKKNFIKQNSTQNLLTQKPQQSSSVYDPASKKLFIQRQQFYIPK